MAYFATMPGVERRAAGDDDDLVDVAQLLVGERISSSCSRPARAMRPSSVSATACGCSSISLRMNQS
jgi:hypothetical protein